MARLYKFAQKEIVLESEKLTLFGHDNASFTYNGVPVMGQGGTITLASVGNTPNINGATLNNGVLSLQAAGPSQPGVLLSYPQTIGGDKTFNGTMMFMGAVRMNTLADFMGATPSINLPYWDATNKWLSKREHYNIQYACKLQGQAATPTLALVALNEVANETSPSSFAAFNLITAANDSITFQKKGMYNIRIQFIFNAGPTTYNVLLKDGPVGGPYNDREQVSNMTGTGADLNFASGWASFMYYLGTDTPTSIQLWVSADSYPTPGTPRVWDGAGQVLVNFISTY